jgi:purine-binding chemotaxis protein CheW
LTFPKKGLTDLNKVIVVRTNAMELGILADAILGIRSIPLQDIQPPLPTWIGIREEYLSGVTNQGLAILDVERILSDRKSVIHEEVDT